MTTSANIVPTPETDGIAYCTNVPITFTEADLGDGVNCSHPIPIAVGDQLMAVVQLSINGYITGNNTYVVMQTDMGDGVWIDLSWIVWNGNQGSVTYSMFTPFATGAPTPSQQTRAIGASPGAASSGKQIGSGPFGRIRFTGQSFPFVGGSSSSPGAGPTLVSATIKYKILAQR